MNKNNFIKVGLVVPKIKLGDAFSNAMEIVKIIEKDKKNAILVFPELTITGYSLGDWILNRQILKDAEMALKYIIEHNDHHILIIGSIFEWKSCLYNVAYIIQGNKIIGIVPKYNLNQVNEANESKYFVNGYNFYDHLEYVSIFDDTAPFGKMLFQTNDESLTFGVEIGTDNTALPAVHQDLYLNGAEVVFNLSSSSYNIKKQTFEKE